MTFKQILIKAIEMLNWKVNSFWPVPIKPYQGQNSVPKRDRHSSMYLGRAQCIEHRHSVFRISTAYLAQAKRIEDKHRLFYRTGTAY